MKTSVALLIAGFACIGCASSAKVAEPPAAPVPDNLKPPAGQTASVTARAVGVQIYECKPKKDDPSQLEWALKGPDAELRDAGGQKIGKHYLGPTWEANDGSKVVGEVKAKDPGPDPAAIPWLMLKAKSTEGAGVLGKTASIQRLYTTGGKAPSDGCGKEAEGAVVRVDYKATYRFYRAQ